jgi:hypothetical protein
MRSATPRSLQVTADSRAPALAAGSEQPEDLCMQRAQGAVDLMRRRTPSTTAAAARRGRLPRAAGRVGLASAAIRHPAHLP